MLCRDREALELWGDEDEERGHHGEGKEDDEQERAEDWQQTLETKKRRRGRGELGCGSQKSEKNATMEKNAMIENVKKTRMMLREVG